MKKQKDIRFVLTFPNHTCISAPVDDAFTKSIRNKYLLRHLNYKRFNEIHFLVNERSARWFIQKATKEYKKLGYDVFIETLSDHYNTFWYGKKTS
jgi:hypothetical protein